MKKRRQQLVAPRHIYFTKESSESMFLFQSAKPINGWNIDSLGHFGKTGCACSAPQYPFEKKRWSHFLFLRNPKSGKLHWPSDYCTSSNLALSILWSCSSSGKKKKTRSKRGFAFFNFDFSELAVVWIIMKQKMGIGWCFVQVPSYRPVISICEEFGLMHPRWVVKLINAMFMQCSTTIQYVLRGEHT